MKTIHWRWYALLLLCLVFGVALTAGCLVWDAKRSGKVTVRNAQEVRVGMSEPEIELLFGGPGQPMSIKGNGPHDPIKVWQSTELFVTISFDAQGKADVITMRIENNDILQRLRAWLGL